LADLNLEVCYDAHLEWPKRGLFIAIVLHRTVYTHTDIEINAAATMETA
jgi:hypothetical protein